MRSAFYHSCFISVVLHITLVGTTALYLRNNYFDYKINMKKGDSATLYTFVPVAESIYQQKENIENDLDAKKFTALLDKTLAEEQARLFKEPKHKEIENVVHPELLPVQYLTASIEESQNEEFTLCKKLTSRRNREPKNNTKRKKVFKTYSKKNMPTSKASDLKQKGIKTTAVAIGKINPKYPRLSRINNEEGIVIIEAIIDTTGHCKKVKVIKSSNYNRLDKAAVKEIMKARFIPARKGRNRVFSKLKLAIKFKLS